MGIDPCRFWSDGLRRNTLVSLETERNVALEEKESTGGAFSDMATDGLRLDGCSGPVRKLKDGSWREPSAGTSTTASVGLAH